MSKRAILTIFLAILFLTTFWSLFVTSVKATTIRVPQDVLTIQQALDMAYDGDTIEVSPGTYAGNFTIRIAITLIGLDKSTTIIDGNKANHTIGVSADNVRISGFTIRNGDKGIYVRRSTGTIIDNNILSNCNASVYISYGSLGATVSGNTISNNLEYGVRLYNTTGNTITGNTVSNNRDGISLGSFTRSNTIAYNTGTRNEFGIRVYNSTGNTIESNIITNNDHGLYVFSNATGNTIRSNLLSSNKYGFQLIDSGNNFLRTNTISSNENNFWVYGENLGDFIQDIDTSNTVDGKPVYYWVNRDNQQVPLDAGYVAVINSTNITVRDLTLTKNYHGVLLAYTDNSIIQNVIVRNNTYGIFLRTSTNDILLGNVMVNNTNDFGVYGTSLPHFIHNIDTSNMVGGKPIYYWTNQNGKTVPTDAGYVGVVNSTNITVKDLTLRNNYQGLLFAYTTNSTIQNVKALNNQFGFYIDYSHNNTITDSMLKYNSFRGVYLYSSNSNAISNNEVARNTGAGIKMHWYSGQNTINNNLVSFNELGMWLDFASDNRIYHNSFVGNTVQATSNNGTNMWNDEANKGNYWSDYTGQDLNHDGIGDTLIPHQGVDYYPLMNPYAPIHDIAVTNVVTSKNIVGQGFTLSIKATVANLGTSPETFDATAYYDTNPITTKTFTLSSGSSVAAIFVWNTTGVAKGNYTITAEAIPVPGETDTADNTLIDGWVFVTIPGDVNGDKYVNIKDAVLLGVAFGSKIGDPTYNPNADINSDGYINIKDAVIQGTNFGKSWT